MGGSDSLMLHVLQHTKGQESAEMQYYEAGPSDYKAKVPQKKIFDVIGKGFIT